MLASEAVKIKMGRFLESSGHFKEVLHVFVLTYDFGNFTYSQLIEDLKTKWFLDRDYDWSITFKIQQFSDFRNYLLQLHEKHDEKFLSSLQICQLEKNPKDYDSDDFKSVLVIICKIMERYNCKCIIMLDEVSMYSSCKTTITEDDRSSSLVDFSYLARYQNIQFVICLRPECYDNGVKDFEVVFPDAPKLQYYQMIKMRYRSTKKIMEFLKYWQVHGPNPYGAGFPSIEGENSLDEKTLPPLLDGFTHGVFWIHSQNDNFIEVLDKVESIFQNLKAKANDVKILSNGFVKKSKVWAEKLKEENKYFNGSYCHEYHFNGSETDIIIYVTNYDLSLQSLARSRRLLVLVTYGSDWNHDSQ